MEQKIDELVKSYRNDMIQSLEELVKIPSVINLESAGEGAPVWSGNPKRLDALMELARRLDSKCGIMTATRLQWIWSRRQGDRDLVPH